MDDAIAASPPRKVTEQTALSYKFQRLREKLRHAISSGELSGKLPGERALAKRFHVNAKTLSKALTDLAAEGVLDRSIGRGTFVKGHAPAPITAKRWLIVCDADQVNWDLVQMLRDVHPETEVSTEVTSVRPSFLNQFSAVIDMAAGTPETFLRDLVVRNIPVVVVGKEPRTYSTHAVLFDGPLAVSQIGRELLLSGHRRLAAVEPRQCTFVADTLRKVAARFAPEATVDSCFPADVAGMIDNGVTAFVCQSCDWVTQVKEELDKLGIPVPERVSLVAVGATYDEQPVSGYFLPWSEKVKAIVQLLNDGQNARPTTLWLAGRFVDRGTTSPLSAVDTGESGMRYSTVSA